MAGPFLYNPRKSGTTKVRRQLELSTYLILISYSQESTLVVTDELLEFVLTLYNPYVFDLEIRSLSLR